MATRYTSIATAALIAGTVGTSLYTASTAQDAREAISAAHDPTTRHGEIIARVDAGGADVTALAAVAPGTAGQVLTVSDAGLPHWAAAAGGSSLPDAAGVADGAVLASVGGAQAWTALGLDPPTLREQAILAARLRRGPVAMRFPTTSDYVQAASTTGTTTPMLGLSTTVVLVYYVPTANAFAADYVVFSGANATRGFFIAFTNHGGTTGTNNDLLVRSMAAGGNRDGWVDEVAASTGWHAVALAIAADGATIRYSIDGGAAATSTPTSALTITSRLDSDAVWIGRDNSGTGCGAAVSYIGIWSSILSDADLVAMTTSPSTRGVPQTAPSAPAWEWAAAAHAGVRDVSIGGYRYASTGTPAVWMP